MMRVLVTGGAGFIGAHLTRALVERGDEPIVVDNLRRGRRDAVAGLADVREVDVRDFDALLGVARGCELVFHLAAQSNVLGAVADVDYSFTTNVVGTFNVLQAAAASGVRKVVFTSSREVYGEQAVLPVGEWAPAAPRNPYGASKLAGEAYCRSWPVMAPIECAVLRLANVYGPGDRDRVIPLWLERASRGEDLVLYGGRQVLDFVYVDLVVSALLRAADVTVDGPVNVGSGTGTPLLGLAERVAALSGRRSGIIVEPARSAEVVRFVADTRRMRSVLGIEPPADPLGELESLWQLTVGGAAAA